MKKSYCKKKIKDLTEKMNEINRALERQSRFCLDENEYYYYYQDALKELEKLQEKIDYYYSNMN